MKEWINKSVTEWMNRWQVKYVCTVKPSAFQAQGLVEIMPYTDYRGFLCQFEIDMKCFIEPKFACSMGGVLLEADAL